MKKLYMVLSLTLLMSSVAFAQAQPADNPANRPTKEEMIAKRKADLTEKLSTLPKDKLEGQKKFLQQKLATETDERKVEAMKLHLEVIDSLLQ